ncbi:FecR family protein [Sinomicrobium sp.]
MKLGKDLDFIVKSLVGEASVDDLDKLSVWLRKPKNEAVFKTFVKINYAMDYNLKDFDADKASEKLLNAISEEKRGRKIGVIRKLSGYAAAALLLFSTAYYFLQYKEEQPLLQIEQKSVTLQLDDGAVKTLQDTDTLAVRSNNGTTIGVQTGNVLDYSKSNTAEVPTYSTLTVPYGKRFNLILADGSKVYLNSGSSLRYPVTFAGEATRKVILKGEAFFEVAKDADHPFVVEAQELNVRALGTSFNVSAYAEDILTGVVLVEGAVGMYAKDKVFNADTDVILRPGMMGNFNRTDQTVDTRVVNTLVYTSWTQGKVVFRNAPFENIVMRLQRLYNVTIINNNETLAKETFNASIEVDRESVEEVLNYFNKIYDVHYRIVQNKIVID